MSNIPIFPGSSSFTTGSTPFGFYDEDPHFVQEADKVALFCARRLGYPMVDVELQDINFYTAFEDAVSAYGNELYAFKIRQDYLSLEGSSTDIMLNNSYVTPNMSHVIRVSEQYGTEAGTGGNVDWKKGKLDLFKNTQSYDLNVWASESGIAPNDIEIKRIFYEGPTAMTKYFDPYAGSGMGMMNLMDSFGFSDGSPAINFLLMPLNYDVQKLQAIELSDQIRRSQYSFEIKNNHLTLFPIPNKNGSLYFEYILKSERLANSISTPNTGSVTDVSNAPYTNPTYQQINFVGRSWIYEYALASCKEMLGYIRGKYQNIPIPDDNVTLNHGDLISAAKDEKEKLITRLREYLNETSRDKLLERRSTEGDWVKKQLAEVPQVIYIG